MSKESLFFPKSFIIDSLAMNVPFWQLSEYVCSSDELLVEDVFDVVAASPAKLLSCPNVTFQAVAEMPSPDSSTNSSPK